MCNGKVKKRGGSSPVGREWEKEGVEGGASIRESTAGGLTWQMDLDHVQSIEGGFSFTSKGER